MRKGLIVLMLSSGVLSAAGQQSGSKVELKNTQGESVGTVTLSPARSGGVSMVLESEEPPAGPARGPLSSVGEMRGAGFRVCRSPLQPGGQETRLVQSGRPARRRRDQLHGTQGRKGEGNFGRGANDARRGDGARHSRRGGRLENGSSRQFRRSNRVRRGHCGRGHQLGSKAPRFPVPGSRFSRTGDRSFFRPPRPS